MADSPWKPSVCLNGTVGDDVWVSHSEEPDSLRAWLKFFFEDPPSVFLVLIKGGLRPGTLAWGVVEAIAAWLEGRPRRRFPGDRR